MTYTVKDLFEAGVHYGHSCSTWNPKMKDYIYGERSGVHIIDIRQTVDLLDKALKTITSIAARSGRILFVGTKPHASEPIKESAIACGQYYVNHRWLGGMLTNWKTVNQSIKRLDEMEKRLDDKDIVLTKKERMKIERDRDHLERAIGGVRKMGGLPQALFVIDIVKEKTAVLEARILNIPVFGIVDTNADPSLVNYIIPGNDDARRAVWLYCDAVKDAVLDGVQKNIAARGIDIDGSPKERPSREYRHSRGGDRNGR